MSIRRAWIPLRERVVFPSVRRTVGRDILWLCRARVSGVEHIPRTGGVIVAFNHPSYLDAPLVSASIPRALYFVGKREIFGPQPLAWWFEHVAGQMPVMASGRNEAVLDAAISSLDAGRAVAIAPEGTRSPDGRLRRGMTGVARLALATGIPVVPVAVVGTYEAWPRWRKLPRPFLRTGIVVGEPIPVERDPVAADDARRCREVTDLVMTRIAGLLGVPFDFPGVRLPSAPLERPLPGLGEKGL
jgi:1-acyl-sn-glycerol-3-phosphate acyltransferase